MSILGIPATRVSEQFVQQQLLNQVQSNLERLYAIETQLSTGKQFQVPSEDPVAAMRVINLQRLLARNSQLQVNLTTNQSYLAASDSALSNVSSMMSDVRGAALGVMGTTATDMQRSAAAQQVEQAIQQLVDAANQKFRGRYLFAGSDTAVQPFTVLPGNLIRYNGNEGRLKSFGSTDLLFDTNLQGNEVFGAISDAVRGSVDLNPTLTWNTRLADLRKGQGISRGSIVVSDGSSTRTIDLSRAETIGDVARLLHANPPSGNTLDVEVTSRGLVLTLGHGDLSIQEAGGTTAAQLGILTNGRPGGRTVVGSDLDPRLQPGTPLADILGSRARAVLRPAAPDSAIVFQADHNGEDLNGVTISIVDDGTVGAGHERVVYDADHKTLTVYIENNHTTAQQVVDAVNEANRQGTAPFTAALDPLDSARGGTHVIQSGTTPPVITGNGSGTDLDQAHGLQIVNGGAPQTIDISGAETIEDLLNVLNSAGAGVLAQINAAGTGIDVRTRISGADFAIGENGGTTAAQLGLRTFTAATPLSVLNFGRGVSDYEGPDFRIARNDGVSFEIDVHGAKTISDVLKLINENPVNQDPANGTPLVARLAAFGNGIELVDNSVGPGRLTVTRISGSPAAVDLGLVPAGQDSNSSSTSGAAPDLLTGADVNPQETSGLFTALLRLHDALLNNDSQEIQRALDMLDEQTTRTNFVRAELGARQQGLDVLKTRLDDEDTQLQSTLSTDYDADITEVVSNLSSAQVALEASFRAIAQTVQLTLLNYL
jgi:flagellin-like hook-associated protein FlgL